jgi:hypothetical protein
MGVRNTSHITQKLGWWYLMTRSYFNHKLHREVWDSLTYPCSLSMSYFPGPSGISFTVTQIHNIFSKAVWVGWLPSVSDECDIHVNFCLYIPVTSTRALGDRCFCSQCSELRRFVCMSVSSCPHWYHHSFLITTSFFSRAFTIYDFY